MSLQVKEENITMFANEKSEAGTSDLIDCPAKTKSKIDISILAGPQNYDKGVPVTFSNFISISRDLHEHPAYKKAPPAYRCVLQEILIRAAWKDMTLNCNGKPFTVRAGQLWTTVRQLADWCGPGIDRNVVQRAIKRFEVSQFVRQEVRQRKLLITVTMPTLYSNSKEESETRSEQKVRHKRRKEQQEKENKQKKDTPQPPQGGGASVDSSEVKIAFGEHGNVFMTQEKYDSLLKRMSGHERDSWIETIDLEVMKQGTESFNKKYKCHYATILSWKRHRENKNAATKTAASHEPESSNEAANDLREALKNRRESGVR